MGEKPEQNEADVKLVNLNAEDAPDEVGGVDFVDMNVKDEAEAEVDYGPPRGTIAFVTLMLTVYIIYYAVMYFEIFIIRGA